METNFSYDSFGNPYSESVTANNATKTVSRRMTDAKTYQFTYPDGKTLRKTATGNNLDSIEYNNSEIASYSRADGVLTAVTKGQNLIETFSYNSWNMLDNHTVSNANADVYDMSYNYSRGWHLIEKADGIRNTSDKYSYDSYYRLRRVDYDCDYNSSDPTCANNRNNVFKCNAAETDCEDFQLDGVHNIRSSYENQTNFAWTVDGFNRLTEKSWNNNTTTYSYDSNNNMTGEDLDGDQNADIVYTYDKLNRLTSVTNSDYLVEYSYDPFNRRTEKTVYYADGNDTFEQTHKYAYNDWDIISEEIKTVRTSDTPNTVTSWQLRRYVDQGTDNHIIMDKVQCSDDGNGNCSPNESTLQRIWFHKDERGNVIAISDGNGTIYERYRYRVYGEHEVLNADFTPKSTAAISPFLWGGSLYEPETNLYWMRNRYYHIDMHRFINQDPIGIWGDANNLGNGFAYVAGMVIEASDPSGLDIWIEDGVNGDVPWHQKISVTDTEDPSGYTSWSFGVIFEDDGKSKRMSNNISAFFGAVGEVYRDNDGKNGKIVAKLRTSSKQDEMARNILNMLTGLNGTYAILSPAGVTCRGFSKNMYSMFKDGVYDFYAAKSLFDKITTNISNEQSSEEPYHAGYDREIIDNGDGTSTERYYDENGNLDTEAVRDNVTGEIILCSGSGCEFLTDDSSSYPYDPNSTMDPIQKILMSNILAKMLKRGEPEQPPFFTDTSTGPNGAIVIYKNPYYVNKDPLKTIFFDGNDGSGKPMIYRNPFVPTNAEYGYDSTTYEKWQQSGFVQPEVDPWLR